MTPDLERLRDDIKRTTTMREVVRICGLPEPGRDSKIRSIFNPNERTPSLHLYEYDWFDFSTGQGGDQISFVQHALGVNYIRALEILGRGMPMAVKPRKEEEVPFELPNYTAKFQSAKVTQDAEHWTQWEKLVMEKWPYLGPAGVMNFGKLVEKGEFWIPHWVDGAIVGIKVRGLDGSKYSVPGSCFTAGLYRPRHVVPDKGHAVVAEGESDAWVLTKMLLDRNVTVFGLPSGAGALKDRFAKELEGFETVGLAFDDDEPGFKAESWFLERLPDKAYVIDVPGGRVAEAAADGWRL